MLPDRKNATTIGVNCQTSMRFAILSLWLFASIVHAHDIGIEMSKDAESFLAKLDPAQRVKATVPFNSDERFNWRFVPADRKGISLKEMNKEQSNAALKILHSALSASGVTKTTSIQQLESVLKEIEKGKGPTRDPELYYLTIFGTPSSHGSWAWRFEGHHLEVQVTLLNGEIVGLTPHFMGANPGRVNENAANTKYQGLEVLAKEDKLGRDLATSLNGTQVALGIVGGKAPSDILSGQSREAKVLQPLGITLADLSNEQQVIFWQIVEEFVLRFKGELSVPTLKALRDVPKNKLTFAWIGGFKEGEGHYYRIQGPDFLIELDNTQNNANHVHTVWRDLKNDFGNDALRRHLATEHSKR